jgi:pantetheine-phosphate adenylyltransferase
MGSYRRTALFAGSFDPPTCGHHDIIRKAAPLFDTLLVGVGTNAGKRAFFTLEERLALLERVVEPFGHVRVASYAGLTADFARAHGVTTLVRGLRACDDFAAERELALGNEVVGGGLPTIFFLATGQHAAVSSRLVREILTAGSLAHAAPFLPEETHELLRTFLARRAARGADKE